MANKHILLAVTLVILLIPIASAGSAGFQLPEREEFIYSWGTLAGTYTIDVDKPKIAFTQIILNYGYTELNAKLTIWPLDENPTNTSISGRTYQFLNIEPIKIREKTIRELSIKFEVDKDWVDDRGKPEDIILMRYSDGVWNELNTTEVDSDYAVYRYESDSPGFSYFAIVLKSPVVEEVTEEEFIEQIKADGVSEEVERKVEGVTSFTFAAIAIVILGGLLAIYFYVKNKKKLS
jgi:PGF-pre-PGF domain-containing protein